MRRISYVALTAELAFAVPGIASAQLRHSLDPAGGNTPSPPPRAQPAEPAPQAEAVEPAAPAPSDQTLAMNTTPTAPVAPPATPGVYTDAQLRSFIAAGAVIDPLTADLTSTDANTR